MVEKTRGANHSTMDENEDESRAHLLPVRTQIQNFENKARLNFNKSFPAPAPPIHLPKIGNYQPKSLMINPNLNSARKDQYQKLKPEEEEKPKYMIIGDKDVPMTIHQSTDITETPSENHFIDRFGSDNPVYEDDENNVLATEKDSILDFEKTVKNPLFEENDSEMIVESASESMNESEAVEKHLIPHKKKAAPPPPVVIPAKDIEEEYPEPDYEPEPDYDEDEVTMNFEESSGMKPLKSSVSESAINSPRGAIYPDYEGEDFSKYMDSEDEDYFSDYTYTWRKNIKYRRRSDQTRPLSQSSKKKEQSQAKHVIEKPKKIPAKHSNHHHKHSKHEEERKRNTIRDFTFTDSKIGYDDRTVKSTTAKGRYMKRGKERQTIQDIGESYEDFLKRRTMENGSVNGGVDSGHETGDDFDAHYHMYQNSQPKQFRDSKRSVWQKLTWRFKRHGNRYNMT